MIDRYPEARGARGTDGTGQDAAKVTAKTVSHLRRTMLRAHARLVEATALKVVAATGLTHEANPPRISELLAMGLIEPTSPRRRNPSGKSASVLCLTDKRRAAL